MRLFQVTLFSAALTSVGCSENTPDPVTPDLTPGPLIGFIDVVVKTAGAVIDADPDGYTLSVDYPIGRVVRAASGTTRLELPAGKHVLRLGGLALNCAVEGENALMLEVVGGRSTAVTFNVSCVANIGTVQVIVRTPSSFFSANRYSAVWPAGSLTLGANDSATIANVRTGRLQVGLFGVPGDCVVDGPNPADVRVLYRVSSTALFVVRCFVFSDDLIAYVDGPSTDEDIYLINSDAGASRRVTKLPGADRDPAWSPDGTRMAFTSARDGNLEIYVMNADGTNTVRLTEASAPDTRPAWSPDGKRLAFVSARDGKQEIYVMNSDGSEVRRITRDVLLADAPDWSPDGKVIAYQSDGNGNNEPANGIWLVNPDGSNRRQLTSNASGDYQPAWSPDGAYVAFARVQLSTTNIFRVNANGSSIVQLTNEKAFTQGRDPSWSPDGRRIAFGGKEVISGCGFYYYYYCDPQPLVATVGASGGSINVVARSGSNPSWRRVPASPSTRSR